MYKKYNNRKKHNGRYTVLGIVLGIILTVLGIYVYDNYREPLISDVNKIKNNIIVDNSESNSIGKTIQPSPVVIKQTTVNLEDLPKLIHIQINSIRKDNGLPPLNFDYNLADIAKAHSQDMVNNNYFSHISTTGESPQDRMKNAGYLCSGWSGENIQENYKSTPDLVNSIIQTWMDSPTHKDNILSQHYYNEGIGVYSNSDDIMITEDFC